MSDTTKGHSLINTYSYIHLHLGIHYQSPRVQSDDSERQISREIMYTVFECCHNPLNPKSISLTVEFVK